LILKGYINRVLGSSAAGWQFLGSPSVNLVSTRNETCGNNTQRVWNFFHKEGYWSMVVLVMCPRLGGSKAPPEGRILNQGSLKRLFTKINPLSPWEVKRHKGAPRWQDGMAPF
jgi:hypothetical protein